MARRYDAKPPLAPAIHTSEKGVQATIALQNLDGAQDRVPFGDGVRQNRATNVHGVASNQLLSCLNGVDLCNQQSAGGSLTVQQGTGNNQVARLNLRTKVLAVSRYFACSSGAA